MVSYEDRTIKEYVADGVASPIPKEGAEKKVDSKTFVWTKRVHSPTVEIYEWVERKPEPDPNDWGMFCG